MGSVREFHEDGWVEYWLRPTDLRDGRESICIGRWPEKVETDELADARAIVAEHDDTPRWNQRLLFRVPRNRPPGTGAGQGSCKR